MTIADEARLLAEVAQDVEPNDNKGFEVDSAYHGSEAKVAEGAQNILRSLGEEGITFTVGDGVIGIDR